MAPRYLPPENVPHQQKAPPRPTPQESLLDLLDRERQQDLRQHLAAVPTAGAHFTEAMAAALLEQALGRNLEGRELQWLAEGWRHSGGWSADLTARAVTAYLARFGPGRHLAYYLEFIQTAHLKARKAEGGARV